MVLGAAAAVVMNLLASADPAPGGEVPRAVPGAALASLEAEQAGLFAQVAPSVVLLVSDGASGSGFVVGPDGLVLTNAHVVGESDDVTVQLFDGRHGRGRVEARATGALDLALVRIPFVDVPPLQAGEPDAARAGTFAATVGHGGGAAWTFSTGLVANPRPLGDGAPLILAQMALRPGSSGGPLVDRRGRAVAVVTSGTKNASGVTFAIRIDAAARAFAQLAGWIPPPGEAPEPSRGADPASPEIAPMTAGAAEPARAVSVARFAAPAPATGMTGWDPSQGTSPVAMVTVWEAKRPKARPRPVPAPPADPIGPALAVHPPAVAPAPVAGGPPVPGPGAVLPVATLIASGLLAAIGLAALGAAAHAGRRR